MTMWIPKKENLRRPVYRSLAESVVSSIKSGELRSGDRLPTHRRLADQLDISVQTVSRAYEELIRRGIITGEIGRGTYIRGPHSDNKTPFLPESHYDSVIDCSILKPVCAEIHMRQMREALATMSEDLPASAIFSFRPSAAMHPFREAAVKWLAVCGLEARAEMVHLTNGSTSAMTIALMSATNQGDLVVTEELGHHTLSPLARYLGIKLKGVRIDEEGVIPADFDLVCENNVVNALYVMPGGLNPTLAMMSSERRKQLISIARKHDVLIIENDAWGPLEPERPAPIASLAPERTFYFTGFSKCIMPGLRTAYLVVPDSHGQAVANRHLATNWVATPLIAEIASRWIEDGTMYDLLDWQRTQLASRNAITSEAMAEIVFHGSQHGLHLWVPLPHQWTEDSFVAQARLNGVAVAPGSLFVISDDEQHPAIRVCIGSMSKTDLERALGILVRLMRSQPEPALLAL